MSSYLIYLFCLAISFNLSRYSFISSTHFSSVIFNSFNNKYTFQSLEIKSTKLFNCNLISSFHFGRASTIALNCHFN